MDPHQLALKNYIDAERAKATPDDSIYKALIESGWQHDMVAQALYTTPADAPDAAANYQPVASADNITPKQLKTIKIIGIITIVLGALAVISSLVTVISAFQIIFGIVEILIGVGLLFYKRTAYTFFNVLAILAILTGLLALPGAALAINIIFIFPSFELISIVLLGLVLSFGQLGFYIYSGIVLHNKAIRSFFKNKRSL